MKFFRSLVCLVTLFLSGCFQAQEQEKSVPYKKLYENGNPQITGFKSQETGKSMGEWKYYDKNGQLKESGFFRNGKEHGEWNRYNRNGDIIATSYYSNGKNYRTIIPWESNSPF